MRMSMWKENGYIRAKERKVKREQKVQNNDSNKK